MMDHKIIQPPCDGDYPGAPLPLVTPQSKNLSPPASREDHRIRINSSTKKYASAGISDVWLIGPQGADQLRWNFKNRTRPGVWSVAKVAASKDLRTTGIQNHPSAIATPSGAHQRVLVFVFFGFWII